MIVIYQAKSAEAGDVLRILLVFISFFLLLGSVSGCGGSKVLKDPEPLVLAQPLASISDERVSATLIWVIVPDGPGTWAKNADWDEYLLKIDNLSQQPIQVTEVVVVDSLNTRAASAPDRKQLVKASKVTARRYKKLGIEIESGAGNMSVLPVAGATAGGAAIGAMTAGGAGMLGSGFATAAAGVFVLAPALAVGGFLRGKNHKAVARQIEQRQTMLPIDVSPGAEVLLNVFFPLAPSPDAVELAYSDMNGEHILAIDTSEVLNGLHIKSDEQDK